jgi:hypothetical protein
MSAVMQERIERPKEGARRIFRREIEAGFEPAGLHLYADAEASELFRVVRLKYPAFAELPEAERERLREQFKCDGKGKIVMPTHLVGERYRKGRGEKPAEGWPLYRLPELMAVDSETPVFIVEGENCADALAGLDVTATTSGGASSAGAADWTPCKGGHCLIWPDNDQPGQDYADTVTAKLEALGCTVERVNVAALDLPEKGDAVDWLEGNPQTTAPDVLKLPRLATKCEAASTEPQPLPSPLPDVPSFDPGLLPESMRAWCKDTAEGLQVPLDFTAIPAVVALAGVIGRRVGIAMKRDDHWLERPMLWGCVVGRPSSGKSPALSPARRMLERLAESDRASYEAGLAEFEARAMVADAEKKATKERVAKAIKKGDKQGAQDAALAARFEEEAPSEPRILVNDTTVEKLGELLNANPNGLLQYRDELAGWLASLEREGRGGEREFWLECWNGTGTYTVDRIGRGTVKIECCAMSILGGMQPGKLAEYVRGALRGGFADDGLIQRFQLAVYPDLPASWRYVDRAPSPGAEVEAWETFKRLRELEPESIGAECADWADVPFLRFDDEAQELFVEWLHDLMPRLRAGDEPPWMESHLAKYPGLVGRLALVLHLADGGTGAVSAETLARALNWCEYLEGHARRIYAPATDNGLTGAHLLLKRRADLPERFTARDVYRHHWAGLAEPDAVADALETLIEYGHLHEVEPEPGALGRPSTMYAWRGK